MTSDDGMERLSDYCRKHAEGDLVSWMAERFSISLAETERAILGSGLLPALYRLYQRLG